MLNVDQLASADLCLGKPYLQDVQHAAKPHGRAADRGAFGTAAGLTDKVQQPSPCRMDGMARA